MKRASSNKFWTIFIGVICLFGLVGLIFLVSQRQARLDRIQPMEIQSGSLDNGQIADHLRGSAEAPVIIYEYADFQCSACSLMHPVVEKVLEHYQGKVAFVYRNFILDYHQHGTAAAAAAEAAGLQGKWQEYSSFLFANQGKWGNVSVERRNQLFADFFMTVTDNQGDRAQFLADMGSERVAKKLHSDQDIAKKLSAPGTPAFYLDGHLMKINGNSVEQFFESFRTQIDAKLTKAQ